MNRNADRERTVVLKFGGTSLAGARRLRTAARIAREAARRAPVVVVVSAMAGVTDALAAAAARASERDVSWREMLLELERRHLDALDELGGSRRFPLTGRRLCHRLEHLRHMLRSVAGGAGDDTTLRARILASGERLSALLFSAELRRSGTAAPVVDGSDLIVTDSSFPEARVDLEATCHRIRSRPAWPAPGTVPIVTGFIGADHYGRTTLLGRGASDLSATILGAALGAGRVEIWTDVPGVLSAPPRWVPAARTVPRLSREEAGALARWGGKVLHPRTMVPLDGSSIPIVIGNSFDPAAGHTVIGPTGSGARTVAVCGRPGIALAAAAGRGRPVVDPLDGRPRGEMVDGGHGPVERGFELAAVALVGSGWDTLAGRLVRQLRLPVLGLVRELEPAACGLVVREHNLRRTVMALHDAVIARRPGNLVARPWRPGLEAAS